MRACPYCSHLIQDAAVYCTRCEKSVEPVRASSERWTAFGVEFQTLSGSERESAWAKLSVEERFFAQREMGIRPPWRSLMGLPVPEQPGRMVLRGRLSAFLLFVALPALLAAGLLALTVFGENRDSEDSAVISIVRQIDRKILELGRTLKSPIRSSETEDSTSSTKSH